MVVVENLTIQPSSATTLILRDINLNIESCSVIMCSERVGSGKTTLARAILGEIEPTNGSVKLATSVLDFALKYPGCQVVL